MCGFFVLRETAQVRKSLIAAREVTGVRKPPHVKVEMLQHITILSKLFAAHIALEAFDLVVERIDMPFEAIFEVKLLFTSRLKALVNYLLISPWFIAIVSSNIGLILPNANVINIRIVWLEILCFILIHRYSL